MLDTIRKRLTPGMGAALVSLAVLALTACTVTPSTTTTPTNTPTNTPPGATATSVTTQTATIGDVATVDGKWQMTVVNFRTFTPTNRTPTAGNQYVAAEVNVKNISSQALRLNETGTFMLSNTAGTQYTGIYVGGISLDLNATIDPGEEHHAVVAFETPTSVTQFVMAFTSPASVDYVRWNLSL